jgi:hypothetical protein
MTGLQDSLSLKLISPAKPGVFLGHAAQDVTAF